MHCQNILFLDLALKPQNNYNKVNKHYVLIHFFPIPQSTNAPWEIKPRTKWKLSFDVTLQSSEPTEMRDVGGKVG